MRGIEHLHPQVMQLANKLVEECNKKGLVIKITDTLRTKVEQNELYEKGRTLPGNIVTNAKFPQSNHCWGIAFDFCRNDGSGAFNDCDGFFKKVGQVGKEMGLFWGGDFASFKDQPHFELQSMGTWKQLLDKYKTFDVFKNTWENIHLDNEKIAVNVNYDGWCKRLQEELNKSYKCGLVVDGIFGSKTLNVCPVVKKGDKGSFTYLIQEKLKDANCFEKGKLDGIFGNHTLKMVKGFQDYYKISKDGIVGKITWQKIANVRK